MTLIEVMIATFLLSVILAATAASLITFTRSAHDNERRVMASAMANRAQEELQSLPWDDAAVYENDLPGLAPLAGTEDTPGYDLVLKGLDSTFEGRPMVVVPGPSGCGGVPNAPCINRRDRMPLTFEQVPIDTADPDGPSYDVFRIVTWDDEDLGIKQFTTIVRWQVRDQVVEQRFDSQRAATAAEAGDPQRPRVIQFEVGPSPMQLSDGWYWEADRPTEDLEVVVRFSRGVSDATIRFYNLSADLRYPQPPPEGEPVPDPPTLTESDLELTTLGLGRDIADPDDPNLFITFSGTIPATTRFPAGSRTFRVSGTLASMPGESFEGATTVEFVGGSGLGPVADPEDEHDPGTIDDNGEDDPPQVPSEPVSLGSISLSRNNVCLDANDRFLRPVELKVRVMGLTTEDHSVTATYTADGTHRAEQMVPVTEAGAVSPTVSSSGTWFVLQLPQGQDHGFRSRDRTRFTITARRAADRAMAGPMQSAQFEVRKPNNPNAPGQGCFT
jgi:type II secretory pathway component PulJ